MNGFVQFGLAEDLERFLAAPKVASLKALGRVLPSLSQNVLILRALSPQDFSEIVALAENLGGKVKASRQYKPL